MSSFYSPATGACLQASQNLSARPKPPIAAPIIGDRSAMTKTGWENQKISPKWAIEEVKIELEYQINESVENF